MINKYDGEREDDEDENEGGEESPESEDGPLTDAPPPGETHGLEHFESLSYSLLNDLKEVVELGLSAAERMMLIKVSLKLFTLAMHDAKEKDFTPESRAEIEALILDLETTLHLTS